MPPCSTNGSDTVRGNPSHLRLISSQRDAPSRRLTPYEERVLARILLGESNREIAERLGCTVKNVEYHVTNILKRTGVPTRLKLIARMTTVR